MTANIRSSYSAASQASTEPDVVIWQLQGPLKTRKAIHGALLNAVQQHAPNDEIALTVLHFTFRARLADLKIIRNNQTTVHPVSTTIIHTALKYIQMLPSHQQNEDLLPPPASTGRSGRPVRPSVEIAQMEASIPRDGPA